MLVTFAARLKTCIETGQMTTADLSRWFDRPYPTVREWLCNNRGPQGWSGKEAYRRLEILERAVSKKRQFPVPVNLSPADRRVYIERVRRELDPPIPATHSAG